MRKGKVTATFHAIVPLCALLSTKGTTNRPEVSGTDSRPLPGPPWGPAGEINCGGSQVCYRGCVPSSIAAKFRYCNHSLTLEERLDALVEEMTFDEKVMIMKAHAHGGCRRIGLPGYEFDSDGLHGYAGPCRNGSKLSCPTTFPAPPTLGNAWNMSAIEAMGVVISTEHRAWHNSEGKRNLSSSDTLGGEFGDTAGTSGQTLEHVGVNVWGPTLNVNRDPRWGRNDESPAEDPWVVGQYGAAWVRGVQQLENPLGNGYIKVAASPKHFSGYSIERGASGGWDDGNMHWSRSNYSGPISAFDLQDTYLPPWEGAISQGGALGIMCSYDGPNGIPSCGNKALQVDVLQKQYGLAGPIVTDCGAIPGMMCSLNFSATPENAVADAINAGVAIDCGPFGGLCDNGHGLQPGNITSFGMPSVMRSAVQQKLVTEKQIDDAFKTAYRVLFRAGLFDPPERVPWTGIGLDEYGAHNHRALAHDLTLQSMVLLQNTNETLPLKSGLKVAVVGPQADNRGGVYTGAAKGGETGAFGGLCGGYRGAVCPPGPDGQATMECVGTVLDALREANEDGETSYAPGVQRQCNGRDPLKQCNISNNFDTTGVAAAAALAKAADIAVLVVGIDTSMEGEGNDRLNTSLSHAQKALGTAVLATGTPTVVIIVNGGAVSIDTLLEPETVGSFRPAAVVEAGYPCDNMQALAELIFGRSNRWGKLAYTIYRENYTLNELPIPTGKQCGCDGTPAAYKSCTSCSIGFLNMSMRPDLSGAGTNPGRSYRWYRGKPMYPFGHGLSYTTFNLSWADDTKPEIITLSANTTLAEHSVLVQNTGRRPGDEVVFAFFYPPETVPEDIRPIRVLYAFRRIADLAPRESSHVTFPLPLERLALVDGAGTRRTYAGKYRLEFSNGVAANRDQGLAKWATELREASIILQEEQIFRSLPEGTGAV